MQDAEEKRIKESYVVAIAGPSGSGKSEVCGVLQKEIGKMLCISVDDYFRDSEELPTIGSWKNKDVPEAIRFDRLARDLGALKDGKRITTSVVKHHHKSGERVEKQFVPTGIILVEGFLVLYDKEVRAMCELKIFIDVSEETQFLRRMRRNSKEKSEYIRQVVIPHYRIYGMPTKKFADVVINGDRSLNEVVREIESAIEDGYQKSASL